MKRVLIGVVTIVLLAAGIYVATRPRSSETTSPSATAAPVKAAANIVAQGKVVPVREAQLALPTGGRVADVLVKEGQQVESGQVLVRLDEAREEAAVSQAQAGVQRAQANLAALTAGPRPEDVDVARAAVDAAKAQLAKLEAGSRPEAIAQAKSDLAAAQANLDFLQSGGRPETVAVAQSGLDQAQAHLAALQTGRPEAISQATANLSAAQAKLDELKAGPTSLQITAAQQAVEQAKDAAYAAGVNKDGACNPAYPHYLCDTAKAQAAAADTAVNQAQAQLSILTSPPTAQQMQQAQAAVDAARAQLDQAQHPGSATDLAAEQQAVTAAQAQLNLAKQPASSADLAKARSAVDVATQQLQLAQQPYTQQDLDAAQAAVRQATAQLAALQAPPRAEAVAAAQADVAAAQATLAQATAALADLELKAPFAGVVANVDVKPGEFVQPGVAITSVADTAAWEIQTTDLTELNATRVRDGQAATLTFDAIPGLTVPATVTSIRQLGTADRGDILYTVTLTPGQQDARFLWNMTAAITIAPGS
jgi:HlyD family secretion protein